jgi:hypothetical protein
VSVEQYWMGKNLKLDRLWRDFVRFRSSAVLLLPFLALVAQAAQIPPAFISSVVALGTRIPDPLPNDAKHTKWFTEGTGFFYGYLLKDEPDPQKRQYEIYLVTAKHVVEEHAANAKTDLNARVDAKDSTRGVQEFPIPINPIAGQSMWFFHPDSSIDIAVVQVNPNVLHDAGFEPGWFVGDQTAADINKLKTLEVSAGDGIFVLGWPLNLAGDQRNYVIVRDGVVARVSEMLDGASKNFLIDALVFPGNSGGPVVLKPDIAAIQGTRNQPAAYLIGVVVSFIPYTELAVSAQTHRPRVSFEENSGLAEVLPVDDINQAIEAWRKIRDAAPKAPPPTVHH